MLNLVNLTGEVRAAMLAEIRGATEGSIYYSPRLSERGRRDYLPLLSQAVESHNDTWLAAQLNSENRLKETELRQGKSVKVPHTAAETLAEGEFNRYYVRAVCLLAVEENPDAEVEIYRAKAVANPRPESQRKVGTRINAAALLRDLRATSNADMNTALGVPAGPNSGLSVRFVEVAA